MLIPRCMLFTETWIGGILGTTLFHKYTNRMEKTKELLMKELSKDKDTNQQKFAVFQARIERKKAYIKAIDSCIEEMKKFANNALTSDLDRAKTWVEIFEMQEKSMAQRQVLGQHISYLTQLKELEDEQNL